MAPPQHADEAFTAYSGSLSHCLADTFGRDALIFVGAVGIAVRAIAPHVSSKLSDPAVLCVDEAGRFVIPILSGHIGGANALARRVAQAIGATAVITTATDINGRFSVDAWAAEQGMAISSMELARRVSAGILIRDIPFCSDGCDAGIALPEGLVWGDSGELGICVSVRERHPFAQTLMLMPRALRIGIGCRRGASAEAIGRAVERVFEENGLLIGAVAGVATIDVKSGEAGLTAYCRERGWPIDYHSAAQLSGVPGTFTASAFVRQTVGVDNVCERAALASGGKLIVSKTALDGVTVAVAELKWGIDFGQDTRGGHRPGQL